MTTTVTDEPARFAGTPRFEIRAKLGAGGMGVVYEAHDRERNARVALKTLRTMSPEELLALKNEFRALQDVAHDNLVALGELIEEADRWFFTMELVDGVNFLRYVWGSDAGETESERSTMSAFDPGADLALSAPRIARARSCDEHRLRYALTQLAHGLNALHGAQKVHRDIKPANVLVTGEGRVVVLDFGLAFDTQREGGWEPRFAGTLGYMAPELFTAGTIDKAGDWYAVGVLMFEALTGRQPFHAPTKLALLDAQQRDGPAPSELVDTVPADLDALCKELLRLDPAQRPDGDEVLRRLGQVARTRTLTRQPFVGRTVEMARLSKAMAEVRVGQIVPLGRAAPSGQTVIVRVRGESGVGKSYLVRQFTHQVLERDPNAVILAGRCYERESVPYKALDGLVDELTGFLSATLASDLPALLPPGVAALAQVFPVLRQVAEIARAPAPPEDRAPHVVRAEASAALRELLHRVAARYPLMVAIDDLHWTDGDSLQFLRELLRPPDAPPFLLIATLRDSQVGQLPIAEIEQAVPVTEPAYDLRLGALSPDDAEQLVAKLADGIDELEAIDAPSIAREAGGHPMFIHELVRHAALGRAMGAELPAVLRIDDAIRARIARLDDASRTIVELVALAGNPLAQGTIARASGVAFDELAQRVMHLRTANLVRTRGGKPLDPIEPVHDRVREAVAGALAAGRRSELHERLASALEGAEAVDPETLALHWRGAGDRARAARYATLAAEQASRAVAFRRAARLYRLALELGDANLPGRPVISEAGDASPPRRPASPVISEAGDASPVISDQQRRTLQIGLGDALANTGDGAAAADAYLAAAAGATIDERVVLERRAAEQLLRAGHIDRGIEQVRTVLSRVGMQLPATPGRALASVLLQRAVVRVRGLGYTERPASQIAPADLARVDICWSLASLGFIDTIRGADFGTRQLLLALRVGEPDRVARAFAVEAVYAAQMSKPARSRRLLAEASRLAERNRQPLVLGIVASTTGLVEYVFGNYRIAREQLARATEYFQACTGVVWETSASQLFALICLYNEGKLDELARQIPPILEEADERGDLFTATSVRAAVQHVAWVAAGRAADAAASIDDAMARWSQTGFQMQHRYALVSHAEIELSCGRDRAAYDRIERRWREIESSMLLQIRQQRIDTLSARGRAAIAAADAAPGGSAAREMISQAARHARAIIGEDMAWSVALGRLIKAAVASALGDDDGAQTELRRAIERCEATGMALHAAVARLRLGALVGGTEGAALRGQADAWMTAAGVLNVDGVMRMLAPGFARRTRSLRNLK